MQTKGGSSLTENDIEYYFDVNLKFLSVIGLECTLSDEGNRKPFRFFKKLPVYMTNIHGIICAIFQVYTIVDALPGDLSLATKVSSQLISNIQCISKGFRVANIIDRLQEVLHEISEVWNKFRPTEKNGIMFSGLHKTLFFSKCYFFVIFSCLICYDIPPLINLFLQYLDREARNYTYDYSQRIFLLKYPFEVNKPWTYFLIYFQEGYLLFMSAVFWGSCDTLFAQTTTHICFQFKILKSNVEKLINREHNANQLKRNLVVLIRRHRQLLSICELIEDVFSPVILSTMLLSALNICVNVFEVRETFSKRDYEETGIYLFIFMCTFLQIVFFCVFAEKLTEQTSSLANSIYNCKWTKKNYRFRFYFQLIMMRCQRPFYCTAYGFFSIGHKQLSSIISTSFSYYMMLQTMGH